MEQGKGLGLYREHVENENENSRSSAYLSKLYFEWNMCLLCLYSDLWHGLHPNINIRDTDSIGTS